MSVHKLPETPAADHEVHQTRVDLAAAHRLAVLHELDEGIDNHFTVNVPGYDDRYLILPFGRHWSEARAGELLVFDGSGQVLEGDASALELSAYCIHAPLHARSGARVVLHTHQTWALALNSLDDNRLLPLNQTAAYFAGRVAYDDIYSGTADFTSEGERLADLLGDKTILFMKNHGVLVVGENIAQAYRRLYMLERVCRAQVLAMSTQRPLAPLPDEVVAQVQSPPQTESHPRAARERLFFDAMKRVLDRQLPGYAD